MIGTNILELNNETLAEAVQNYLNEHVFREKVHVLGVTRENMPGTNDRRWVAYIEPAVSLKLEIPEEIK